MGPLKDQDLGAEAALEVLRAALAGRYLLKREIGRGATAQVYLADDMKYDRPVAVKVLRAEVVGRVGVERFLREIRLEARLQHPNIIPLYDSGEVQGPADGPPVTYCVMPYVEAESLRKRLKRERQLPVADALSIARDVASALAFAHGRGIVHRDIKPENILLSGDRALVADFGIARAIAAAGTDRLTEEGLAVGTPMYMSPEQAAAEPVDGRSDIYALGCVLYEMLAGEPPFVGPTVQVVVLRHLHDPPTPLSTLRPSLPPHVSDAVAVALAKVPADRFPSALDFSRALETATTLSGTSAATRARVLRWWPLAVAVAGFAALGVWRFAGRAEALEPNRVVVFPLRDHGQVGTDASGADVATYIGHVLEGSDPLKWEEGRDFVPRGAPAGELSTEQASRIARSRGARYYVDGSVLREPDSLTVLLRLFDAQGDSLVKRAGRSGSVGISAARLGAIAVADLLPALLEPGRKVDVGGLGERSPAAITAFLQGERAYRLMRFPEALDHYRRAVEDDSLFALAAVKGAQAASWMSRAGEAEALTALAQRHLGLLPARYAEFVRGWALYQVGRADSALVHLRRAVELSPGWSEGWMALGELYYHLLPKQAPLDSLADAAFREAHRLDPEFTPAQYHLTEIALVRGDLERARRLASRFRRSSEDSANSAALLLMVRCARAGLDSGGWQAAADRNYAEVMDAAATLSRAPPLRRCARDAFQAVLAVDSATDAYRFNALLGLHALWLNDGNYGEAGRLAETPDGKRYHFDLLFLLDAAAGIAFQPEAAALARSQGTSYGAMSSPVLWARGTWEARRGDPKAAAGIAAVLAARADSSATHDDSLFAAIVAAHATLAAGDTAAAERRLTALTPAAPLEKLAWSLWEPLGLERLALADLYLAQGRQQDAIRAAATLDAPRPFSYLLYRPASLELRRRAARELQRGHEGELELK